MSTTIAAWSSSAITLPGSALRIVTRSPLFERVSQFAYIHSLWVHAVIAVLVCAVRTHETQTPTMAVVCTGLAG